MTIKARLQADQSKILELYRSGITTRQIGRQYSCSSASVYLRLREWGEPIRERHLTEEEKQSAIEMLRAGQSAHSIGKKLGFTTTPIAKIAKEIGLDISSRWTTSELSVMARSDEIVSWYASGSGVPAIANRIGCAQGSICYVLKKLGVKRRTHRDYAHPIDETFFDVIDFEEKAYVLGLMMADGCVHSRGTAISLCMTDRDAIEKTSAALSYQGPIVTISPKKPWYKPQYGIHFGSRRMWDSLNRLGCTPRKSYTATVPEITSDLRSHLIRGWFDGDGWICRKKRVNNWQWGVCGTEAAMKGVGEIVGEATGCLPVVRPRPRKERGDGFRSTTTIWSCEYGSRQTVADVLGFMYQNATIYLDRKYERSRRFFSETCQDSSAIFRGI